jgi:hypothetical protein
MRAGTPFCCATDERRATSDGAGSLIREPRRPARSVLTCRLPTSWSEGDSSLLFRTLRLCLQPGIDFRVDRKSLEQRTAACGWPFSLPGRAHHRGPGTWCGGKQCATRRWDGCPGLARECVDARGGVRSRHWCLLSPWRQGVALVICPTETDLPTSRIIVCTT